MVRRRDRGKERVVSLEDESLLGQRLAHEIEEVTDVELD